MDEKSPFTAVEGRLTKWAYISEACRNDAFSILPHVDGLEPAGAVVRAAVACY